MKRGQKDLGEALESIRSWWESGKVGNLIFFKAPKANLCDSFIEQTIKVYEMTDAERAAFDMVFNVFKFERAELFRNDQGKPDRIKLTKGN